MDHIDRDKRRRTLAKRFRAGEPIEALTDSGLTLYTLKFYLRKDCPEEWEKRRQNKPTAKRRGKVKELWVHGIDRGTIAKRLGETNHTVLKDFEALGIKVPRASKNRSQQHTTVLIVADILEGLTDEEISRQRKNAVERVARIRTWMWDACIL